MVTMGLFFSRIFFQACGDTPHSAAGVSGALGVVAGLCSGYFGGRIDDVTMRLGDMQLAFPFVLLAIMFLVVLGPGL
ncbi:MAG TPA: hypothetical protein PKJ15_07755, partial [Methanomassiliicoccales archaeon]|nr:hypothetical protein [Methanomassiliicoccales archaeon]